MKILQQNPRIPSGRRLFSALSPLLESYNPVFLFLALASLICTFSVSAQDSYEEWLKNDRENFAAYEAKITRAYGKYLEEEAAAYNAFVKEAGKRWGENNVWVPQKTTWVQYREDWEERSSVQCEDGIAKVEVIVSDNADDAEIKKAVADAVETLVLSGSISPVELMRRKLFPSSIPAGKEPPAQLPALSQSESIPTTVVYTVKAGDGLWKLSRKFKISRRAIAEANNISPDDWLKIGQKLKIPAESPVLPEKADKSEFIVHRSPSTPNAPVQRATYSVQRTPGATADPRLAKPGSPPLLAHQLRMEDGSEVDKTNARQFAEHVAASPKTADRLITGSDGKTRRAISAQFPLVPNHIQIRAERFRPLVIKYAHKEGIYAPLVFAIIHSESAFNPRARSGVPAYGLMQLVPRSGARDAYRYVHKKDKLVSGSFLYNPENNIELGVAFLHILDKRYFRRIENPMSRMLCSIAAYNTGAGNVCRAFGAGTSLTRAAPIINRMQPTEVYTRLRKDLPYAETRNYVKKVSDRIPLYKAWK